MAFSYIRINGIDFTLKEVKLIVLQLHAFTQPQMGDFLNFTESTTRSYIRDLYNKVDVHCVVELIRFSIKGSFDIDGHYKGQTFIDLEELKKYKDKYKIWDFDGLKEEIK